MNRHGRRIYALCDGRRTEEAICRAYAEATGSPARTAADFMTALQQHGLIVYGGYAVLSKGFPKPAGGGSYVHRF